MVGGRTAEITEAASLEGTSIGMKMVATGHSAVVEGRRVVTVVEAAAGKLVGVLLLLWAAAEYVSRERGRRKREMAIVEGIPDAPDVTRGYEQTLRRLHFCYEW